MEPSTFGRLPYEKLVSYTDNFSESNCIGDFQFGKLYRAKTSSHDNPYNLLVKKWEVPSHRDNEVRLMKEAILLRHEMLINHPGMAPLYGYHWEGQNLVAIYDFKPFDSLFNLIPKDDFTWIQRIKAVLGLASLLKFLHARRKSTCKPFVVQNLEAAHVVLDEDYNPKLCDFGSMTGGIFTEGRNTSANDDIGCCGCINTGQDVFAFGVILLSLISKRAYTEEDLLAGVIQFFYEQALRESGAFDMKTIASSFVHKSFAGAHGFHCADGHKITELALECVNTDESQRPTMKQVCRFLLHKLEIVKQHADFLGVRKDVRP